MGHLSKLDRSAFAMRNGESPRGFNTLVFLRANRKSKRDQAASGVTGAPFHFVRLPWGGSFGQTDEAERCTRHADTAKPNAGAPDYPVDATDLPAPPLPFNDVEEDPAAPNCELPGPKHCRPAAAEAGAALRAYLVEAVKRVRFSFEGAMAKHFDTCCLLQVQEEVSFSIPASVGAEVLTQANEFVRAMLCKDDNVFSDEDMAIEALQSIGLSLGVLACSFEHDGKRGAELGSQCEEHMALVTKLFGKCLQCWATASMDEMDEGERSAKRLKKERFSG